MAQKYNTIKLEDLARKLNVSKVTISKALRDHPDISSQTIEKVKKLADEMGYMPNYLARKLSSRKSNIIGLVVPKVAHIFFSSIIESIYDEAFKHSYEILLAVSQENAERERKLILSLMSMRVDGIIMSITQETKDTAIFEKAIEQGVPLIFIDRIPDVSKVSSITSDDREGAFNATEYAIKKGYKKIGFLGGFRYINIGHSRYNGFMDAMRLYNIPVYEDWITEGGFGEEDGYNAFRKIYSSGNLPEYILAVTYPVALGMFTAASELGINIPGDIEVTCFGTNSFARKIAPVFNFVDLPTKELGAEAFNMMINCINNHKNYDIKHLELKTRFVQSNSTKSKQVPIL